MIDPMETIQFKAKDGQTYDIYVDDFGEEIVVELNGQPQGSIHLRLLEGDGRGMQDSYYITQLELTCGNKGIGRRCLQFHHDVFGCIITASSDDGTRRDDGSHLTGAGPGFIRKMIEEGLVLGQPTGFEEEE